MNKITKDTTFIRSVIARKDDKIKTSFITQPYLTGMYVAITIPELSTPIQQSHSYKSFNKWIKNTIKLMKEDGLVLEIKEMKHGDWFTEEQIAQYIN